MAATDLEFLGNVRRAGRHGLLQEPQTDFPLSFAHTLQRLVNPGAGCFNDFVGFFNRIGAGEVEVFQAVNRVNSRGELDAVGFENYPEKGNELIRFIFLSSGDDSLESGYRRFLQNIGFIRRHVSHIGGGNLSDEFLIGGYPLQSDVPCFSGVLAG